MAVEGVRNGDGSTKNGCERSAWPRLIPVLASLYRRMKVIVIADGLFSHGPQIRLLQEHGLRFLLAARAGDHPHLQAQMDRADAPWFADPSPEQWHSFSELCHSVKDSVLGLGYPLIFYSVSELPVPVLLCFAATFRSVFGIAVHRTYPDGAVADTGRSRRPYGLRFPGGRMPAEVAGSRCWPPPPQTVWAECGSGVPSA